MRATRPGVSFEGFASRRLTLAGLLVTRFDPLRMETIVRRTFSVCLHHHFLKMTATAPTIMAKPT